MNDLSAQLAALSPTQRALLERRLKQKGLSPLRETRIPKRTAADECPLSFAQQRLWFVQQFDPENRSYNVFNALRLRGDLNQAALQQALTELVRRHEILRTTFNSTAEGQPIQQIHAPQPVLLPVVDLRDRPDRLAEVERLIQDAIQHQFDLSEPLLHVTLFHLADAESILLVVAHHIIFDRWSVGVFLREMQALYAVFAQGQPSPLPELPIQYADWAIWQQIQKDTFESQLAYWTQQLAGDLALLDLPIDHPRPSVQTYRGSHVGFKLSESLTEALKALSVRQGVTLFMLLLAAFKTLLYRYTHQTDILVTTDIANRDRTETESLIGLLVNTLLLRTDLSGNPLFTDLLSQVQQVTLGAYANQELPFEKVVAALNPERHLSLTPLYQVGFDFQQAPEAPLELLDLEVQSLPLANGTAKLELRLNLWQDGSQLAGQVEYNTDLFKASTIARLVEHFQQLLSSIVASPDRRLSDLRLLTPSEEQQLLFSETVPPVATLPTGIHVWIETQVEQTPDAIALVLQDQQLTYRELNSRVNQLAHELRSRGVGADTLVGLCLERSPEMVIGLLGILKAGGAYLPLDPSYPAERLSFMLQDAQISLLLTQQHLRERLPDVAQILCLDTDWGAIATKPSTNPESLTIPDHIAYVIYTSGSTGTPKGVMIPHRALVSYIQAIQTEYALTGCDRILQFTSLSFDVAAEEIFASLVSGSTLVLRSPTLLDSTSVFLHHCQEMELTALALPTAFWHQLVVDLADAELALPAAMRLMVIGGERALPERWQIWQQINPSVRLLNNYGPTEATIGATVCDLRAGARNDQPVQEVPVGRPLPHLQTYILDRDRQPVPVGIPGELYIGGAGLAQGYLNRADLTAERFLPHPFSTQPGARLYRTGDLARYRSDGQIECLGRLDHQVKLRGFRIELGEIEAAIRQHPTVQDVVVDIHTESGISRLVVYVVFAADGAIAPLQEFLKQRLPSYMVPTVWMSLDVLPLSPNGKLDRRALPAPESRDRSDLPPVVPQTDLEKALAQIWSAVLRVETIGIHDNFFELGGDSILSLQIIARAHQAGLHLTPKQLFQHQTIAELATVVTTISHSSAEQGTITGTVPLTPIQKWFFEQSFPEPHHFNQAVLLNVREPLQIEPFRRALQVLVQHHDALRSRFTQIEDRWQQTILPTASDVPIIHIDLKEIPLVQQDVEIEAIANHVQASLSLDTAPLIRVALFDCGTNQPQSCLFIVHHLVIDGVSWRILLEDLQTVYGQICQNQSIRLPSKTTSVQQWAHRLQTYAHHGTVQQEISFWLDHLCPTEFTLPTDHPRSTNRVADAASLTVRLSARETDALLHDVPAVYHTQVNDVLLTALAQGVAQWTERSQVWLDLEGHGREDLFDEVDLSRTIGWFTTQFPLCLELSPRDDLGEMLKRVKEQLRKLPQQGLGYGLLRYLNSDAHSLRSPSAPILFNYLGQFDQALADTDLFQWSAVSSGHPRSLQQSRSHLLEVNVVIAGGELQWSWTYSRQIHELSTIDAIAQICLQALRDLIDHCRTPEAGGYTPSDFPLAQLSQQELDDLLLELD